jgi:hypothetical protein
LKWKRLSEWLQLGQTLTDAFEKAGISTCIVMHSYPILGQEIYHIGINRGGVSSPYPSLESNAAGLSGKSSSSATAAIVFRMLMPGSTWLD